MKNSSNKAADPTIGRSKKTKVKEQSNLQTEQVLEHLNKLESEASALFNRVRSKPNVRTLQQMIKLSEQAVDVAPRESARHGMAVITLISALGWLYRLTKDEAVYQKANNIVLYWLKEMPDDWRMPLYVLASAELVFARAIGTDREDYEDLAIESLKLALSSVKTGTGVYCTASTRLAQIRFKRYKRTLDLEDLSRGIHHALEVIKAPRSRSWERRECYKWFARGMIERYEVLGSISDLDVALEAIEMSLKDELNQRERAEFYSVLGTTLRYRFLQIADPADLNRAIDSYKRAFQEETDDEMRAINISNYANGLADRYDLTHKPVDLHESIASSQEALDLLPKKSSQRVHALANLGYSLFEMYAETREKAYLSKAVKILSQGLNNTTATLSELQRIHAMLARTLLHKAAINPKPNNLIRKALDHFEKAREITNSQSEQLIRIDFLAVERNLLITDLEVGALLWKSELDPASAPELLRRALEVGEGAKSRSLATDLARRPLPRPADVPKELFEQERWYLGQLSGLDNIEIAGIPWAYQVRNADLREHIQRQLESIWTRIAQASPAGARYVQMRQSPGRWLDSVHHLNQNKAVLSLLPIRTVQTGRLFEAKGIVVLGIIPGNMEPFIIAKNLLLDPVPSASRQFEAEVPGDGGLGTRLETWHRPLQALLGNQTHDHIKQTQTIIISPSRDGNNLPWNLVLQRVGWRSDDGNILPVITLPTLAIIAHMPIPSGGKPDEQNLPTNRMGYYEPRTIDEAKKLILRVAGFWSGPLVVGNPTEDLPGAAKEARAIANMLGVKPLIGGEVAIETVLKAFYRAPIIHLAAHAWFDERDPLDSRILLADGEISARELVRSSSEAELVVLSSCEGGVASRVIGGEISGLGHALLRAGARAVVASLWPVDDDATAFLMAEFYRARLTGVDEASALAKAMHITSEQTLWRHPYFWSGFVLMKGG